MKSRIPFTTGDEYDALTKRGRAVHRFKAGRRAEIKRGYRRRCRRVLSHFPWEFDEDVFGVGVAFWATATE